LFFQDEARIGQKGRVCHVWWTRGKRPPGLCDRRFTFAYIFAAVEPGTDLRSSSASCGSAPLGGLRPGHALCRYGGNAGVPQPVLKDRRRGRARRHDPGQAGWHGSNALAVPANITLVPLPPYSPELNPVERVWLYLKERFLSHRLLDDYDAIVTAACNAWNRLLAEAGRIRTLCSYPWIPQVNV
jgi:hypothetical protein